MKRFQAIGAGLILTGVLALAACGDRDAETGVTSESTEAERGGTAIVVESADMGTPMPLVAGTALDVNLAFDVLNMELVRGEWEDGELVHRTADQNPMAIARRYEYVGPDSAALRFHMRSDLRWSDGQPLTARDVVFSYELLDDPALASPRQDYVEHLDSIVAENDSTVTFYFARPYPEMLAHSTFAPVPEHIFRDVDPANLRTHPTLLDPTGGKLVTSGPWMIGQWVKGQRVTLVPNPHFQPRPNLDQIVFRVVPELTTRMVELQTGNVDMVTALNAFDQLPALRAQTPDVSIAREEKRFFDYIGYNPRAHPAFADPEIRRALGMAIDVPTMLTALRMEDYAVQGGGPYAPIMKQHDPQLTPPLSYDPERARQILESKGWRDADGDGVRESNGRPLRFTLLINSGNQRRADAAQIIQQQWRQVGVDAELQTMEFNTVFQRMLRKEYDAVMGTWGVNLSPDLTQMWGPEAPFNITGYRDPEVTALFERALAQRTKEAANPFWKQAAAKIAEDQPYTWLFYFDQVDALSPRLRGTKIDTYGPYQNTWDWWIPQSMQRGAAPTTP